MSVLTRARLRKEITAFLTFKRALGYPLSSQRVHAAQLRAFYHPWPTVAVAD